MDEERLKDIARSPKESQKLTSGQWLWKKIKPAGCIAVLGMAVIALIICFAAGSNPIDGYSAPHDTAYYAENFPELASELNANVLPQLKGNGYAEAGEEKVCVTIDEYYFASARSGVLHYFDESLIDFEKR